MGKARLPRLFLAGSRAEWDGRISRANAVDGDDSLGGQWNWDRDKAAYGYKAGIGVFNPSAPLEQFILIDEMIDDGDLSSGYFRSRPNGYVWIIEQ